MLVLNDMRAQRFQSLFKGAIFHVRQRAGAQGGSGLPLCRDALPGSRVLHKPQARHKRLPAPCIDPGDQRVAQMLKLHGHRSGAGNAQCAC